MTRITGAVLTTCAVACLLAPPASAAEPSPTPVRRSVAELAWMAGHWVGEGGDDLSEEIWTAPAAGSIVGMWRWASEERLKLLELLAVTEEDGGLVLRLRHFEPDLVGWEERDEPLELPLAELSPREVVFAGEAHGGPIRLTYRLENPDRLVAILEREGRRDEFRYRRTR